jgi:hypothetical protein
MVDRNAGGPPERQIQFRIGIRLGDPSSTKTMATLADDLKIAGDLMGFVGALAREARLS